MMKHFKLVPMFILIAGILLVGCGGQMAAPTAVPPVEAAQSEPAADTPGTASQIDCQPAQGETAEIAEAKLYIEFNATDEDLGIHGYLGDDGWSEFCIYNPSGDLMLAIKPQAQLKDVTMASVFFEGREPSLDEFGFEELKSFPEGKYEVRALSYDGTSRAGAATFSRAVPAPPLVTFPPLAEEENAGNAPVSTSDLVVTWEDVTETIDGSPVTISGYELIITKVDHDDPHGFSQPIYDVHVSADMNSLSVPAEFFETDAVYELEVLALEESGNQTITVGFFTSAEDENAAVPTTLMIGPGEAYNPEINPEDFTTDITNPYFSLPIGKKMVYESETPEGLEAIEILVPGWTRTVAGVETLVFWDRVYLDGELIEDTRDYVAQHKETGDVWYFGEHVDNYEDGVIVDHDGAWITGEDNAKPGIWALANPQVGDKFRNEYRAGEAEDETEVLSINETVTVPYGKFTECIKNLDGSPLFTAQAHAYLCKGAGAEVLGIDLAGPDAPEEIRVELVDIDPTGAIGIELPDAYTDEGVNP